jgi:hypothetical protein
MTWPARIVLALALAILATPAVHAEGGDYPKERLAQQGANCVHGYYVNWEDTFFYAGETAAFNKFVEAYGKRDDVKLRVVIHSGTKRARSPWDQGDRDIAVDWSLYVWNTGTIDPKNLGPSRVDVWLGSRIKLVELRIPANIEVVSGGEIEKFVARRRQP